MATVIIYKILQAIIDTFADSLYLPVSVKRAIIEYPGLITCINTPEKTILYDSVPKWWRINKEGGFIRGFAKERGFYCGAKREIPSLNDLVRVETIENWTCDILDVEGLNASKSPLRNCSTLDEFAERYCADLISDLSEENLLECLMWDEVRIYGGKGDYFEISNWDGRVFLMNSGGSHHFAAARYIARKLGRRVPLSGNLHIRRLDIDALCKILNEFEMFALRDSFFYHTMHDALMSFGAAYFRTSAPPPYKNILILFLPKSERRANIVAKTFSKLGVFNVGNHLKRLVFAEH